MTEPLQDEHNRLHEAKERAARRWQRSKSDPKATAAYEAACAAERECWKRWQPFTSEDADALIDG